MANPKYAIQNMQSNILSYETLKEYGFCRQAASATANTTDVGFETYPIDNSSGELQLGSLVYFDTDKWTPYTDAEVVTGTALGTATGIVIGTDELGGAVGEVDPATGAPKAFETGDVGGMLIVNGTAVVRAKYLSGTGGSTATVGDIKALVESAMVMVKVANSSDLFDGTYGDEDSITN